MNSAYNIMFIIFHLNHWSPFHSNKSHLQISFFLCSEKKRIPAWCDRILYKVQTDLAGLGARKKKYASPAYKVGDHKPVVASFEINVSIPVLV